MGYVASHNSASGTTLWGELRGKRMPVEIVDLPFVPPGFKR
jgi:aminomethyltransferase